VWRLVPVQKTTTQTFSIQVCTPAKRNLSRNDDRSETARDLYWRRTRLRLRRYDRGLTPVAPVRLKPSPVNLQDYLCPQPLALVVGRRGNWSDTPPRTIIDLGTRRGAALPVGRDRVLPNVEPASSSSPSANQSRPRVRGGGSRLAREPVDPPLEAGPCRGLTGRSAKNGVPSQMGGMRARYLQKRSLPSTADRRHGRGVALMVAV
jgi:hypothetical protein